MMAQSPIRQIVLGNSGTPLRLVAHPSPHVEDLFERVFFVYNNFIFFPLIELAKRFQTPSKPRDLMQS